jgi:broad specificity phosphatase PhoE
MWPNTSGTGEDLMLYLIRHARTQIDPSRPISEWDLQPEGRADLIRLAGARDWDAIPRWYASTEPKAVLTAQALTRRPVTQVHDLREVERGSGLVDDYEAAVRRLFTSPDQPALPGWETAAAAQRRFAAAVEAIRAEAGGDDVAIVAHGLVITLYLAHLREHDRASLEDWRSIGFADYAVLDGAQVIQWFQGPTL